MATRDWQASVSQIEGRILQKHSIPVVRRSGYVWEVDGWVYELVTATMSGDGSVLDRVLDRMGRVHGSIDVVKTIVEQLGYLNEGVEVAIQNYLREIGALS